MMVEHVVITGANRGIGLAFVDAFLAQGAVVYAGCRTPNESTDLQSRREDHPEHLHILQLDVLDDDTLQKFVDDVGSATGYIDVLVNNAAVFSRTPLAEITREDSLGVFAVNSVGPVLVYRAMLPLLRQAERPIVVNISSSRGSVSGQQDAKLWDYAASKAALNSYMRKMSYDLTPQGIAIAIDPGWVQTRMGGDEAALTPAQSVAGMMQIVAQLDETQNGAFFLWNGERQAW